MNIEEVRNLIEIIDIMKECVNNDEYFEITDEDVKVLYKYITDLQEENRTLKEFNECAGCNPDYESRINKAIEYIENNEYVDLALIRNETNGKCDKISKNGLIKKQPILDILKGEE